MNTENTLKFSTEFMKNQKAASVLPAQSKFESFQDSEGQAMFFSISDDGGFYLSAEKTGSNSGWVGKKLCQGLAKLSNGKDPLCKDFAISQDDTSGDLTMALVATVDGGDHLYLMTGLSNQPDAQWMDPETKELDWVPRKFDADGNGGDNIDYVHLAKTAGSAEPPRMVAGRKDPGTGYIQNYIVSTDSGANEKIWEKFQTAENYDTMMDQHIGKPASALDQGLYQLYEIDGQQALTFTPFSSPFGGAPPVMKLNPPANSTSLAVLPNDDENNTELYLAADGGIHHLDAKEQKKGATPARIIDNEIVSGVSRLYAHSLGGERVLFARNDKGEFFYSRCNNAANIMEPSAWSTPVPIEANVENIATYINNKTGAEEIFTHIGDRELKRFSRDPVSTAWATASITLEALDDTFDFNTYTTRISVNDANNIPLADCRVNISASSPCNVYIDNMYRSLGPDWQVEASTDKLGRLSILHPVDGLRGVSYTITPKNGKAVTIQPMDTVHQRILDTEDPSKVTLTDEKGNTKPLIPAGTSKADKEVVIEAFKQLKTMEISENGTVNATAAKTRSLDQEPVIWGFIRENGSLSYHQGHDAMNAFGVAKAPSQKGHFLDDSIALTVGDLISWMEHAFEKVVHHFIQLIEDTYYFFIKIGETLYRCALKVLGDVLNAMEYIFKQILVGIMEMLEWLGWIFNWKDILKYKKVFYHFMELTKQKADEDLVGLEEKVEQGIAKLESLLDTLGGLDPSHDVFGNKVSEGSKTASETHSQSQGVMDSPALNWIYDHILSFLDIIKIDPDDFKQLMTEIAETLKDALDTDVEAIEQVIKQVYDEVIENFSSLSTADIFKKLLAIVSKGVVDLVGEAVITTIKTAKIIVDVVWIIAKAEINIPVITKFYEEVITGDGSKLSLLDLCCLMGAIAAEVGCKVVGMSTPGDHALDTFTKTKSMEEFIDKLSNHTLNTAVPNASMAHRRTAVSFIRVPPEFKAVLNSSKGIRLQGGPTGIDWIATSMEYANVLLYGGIMIGDLCEFAADLDPTGEAGKALKVPYGIRMVCSFIQTGYTAFTYYVWAHRQLGLSPLVEIQLTAAALGGLLFLCGAAVKCFPSFFDKGMQFIEKNWKAISAVVTVLSALVAVGIALFKLGFKIYVLVDRIANKKKYYGSSQEGENLFAADLVVISMRTLQIGARGLVPIASIINKIAAKFAKDPRVQAVICGVCGVVIYTCDAIVPLISLVDAGLLTAECAYGYRVDIFDIPGAK